MNIAIISDTHDNIENLKKALKFIKENKIKKIIHCGDVCESSTLEMLAKEFPGKIYLTFGNAEFDKEKMKEKAKNLSNIKVFEERGEIKIKDLRIEFSHFLENTKKCPDWKADFIFYGHTHRPWFQKQKNHIFANPGNLSGLYYKPTFAILDTKTKKIELKLLERL